jgi:hypothetical protein
MNAPVTIASLQSHGVRQLLVYCLGKREGDWPCHHSGKLPIDRFQAGEVLSDIERRHISRRLQDAHLILNQEKDL